MKHRKMFLLAGGLTTGMVIAVACSFPDPQLVPDEGGAPDGTADTGEDVATGDAGTDADATIAPDIAVPDSEPPVDANGEKPDIDATGCTCDCDKDGWRGDAATDAKVCVDLEGGTLDCDDLEPRAYPDAGFVTDQPTLPTKGDWNCDGHVTRQYNVNIDCSPYGGLSITTCPGVAGFTSDPACGESATYITCKANGVSCVAGTTDTKIQGCK